METNIKLFEIYEVKILALRQNIRALSRKMDLTHTYTLDFDGIEFISRSATDEVFNLENEGYKIKLQNVSKDIEEMFKVVKEGRERPRNLQEKGNGEVINCETFEQLMDVFK